MSSYLKDYQAWKAKGDVLAGLRWMIDDMVRSSDQVKEVGKAAIAALQERGQQPIIDRIRAIAMEHGWAIGVHGSLVRDIDLIAAPWTATASAWKVMADAVAEGIDYLLCSPTERPHGRQCVLLIAKDAESDHSRVNTGRQEKPTPKGQWFPPAIDLSIMSQPTAYPTRDQHASAILSRLVAAKDEKDANGETDRYRELKAGAWEAARAVVRA